MHREPRSRRLAGPRWRTLVAVGCTVAGIAGMLGAWQQPGFPEVPPLPVDSSVWVVNDSRLLVGRINTGIGELDSAALVRGASDVLQDPMRQSGSVLVVDETKHELQVLDTATVTFGARVSIPDDAAVQWRGGTLTVADRMDGRLWVGDGAAVASVDARTVDPQATLGALPVLAVSNAGTVFATAAGASTLLRIAPGTEPVSSLLPDGPLSLGQAESGGSTAADDPVGDVQITTVGETPVVLDRPDSSLRIDGRLIVLPGLTGAVLQQPGPAAPEVLVATPDGLLDIALDDGSVRTRARVAGTPVAPVVNGGCSFGAWVSDDRSVQGTATRAVTLCDAAEPGASTEPVELTSPDVGGTPAYRQRGGAVVLADRTTGRSWVATDGFRSVDDWDGVAPLDPVADEAANVDDPTTSADLLKLPPDCTAVPIGEPRAVDDRFGVRAGRATVLRILDNDPSVDCTPVVIDSVSALPAAEGTVAIVADGGAIQVTVPTTATGQLSAIEYQVGNGRGGIATARVLIDVVPAKETAPPERVRRSAVTTEVNDTVSYNVLDDFVSPTGDDLFLVSATTGSADVVSFRADGTISYRNTGTGAGSERKVDFVVSDGVELSTGTLTVAIARADSTTPVVYPSFTRAVIGAVAVAHPLTSVTSAAADPVIISTVRPEPGSGAATARLDPQDGSVAITATDPGSYYFTFEASTGGRGVTGVLRADFIASNDTSRSVVPMTDVAFLAPGKQVVIDPLTNDTDPDGQGLAVREVNLAPDAPITAAVVDLHLVQVSAPRNLRGTVVFDYSVFDGTTTQIGQIRVVPVPAPKVIPPPLASPMTATVRAGDAVTIPVARFVTSQDGSPVTAELDPAQVAALPGRAFSTGDSIRYLAPADAPLGPVSFSYTAVAGSSTPARPVQKVSTVTITVTSGDPAVDLPPNTPTPVTARAFAGGAISISVPLAGTDPGGDWVVLSSLEQPEAPLGKIAISGPDTLSYTAFDVPGVDRIRYLATDPSGQRVTGEITVLVAEPSATARPPVAPDLAVSARPSASIRIDPVSAVVDSGGQPVELASPAFTATAGLQVQVEDQSLIVTAPPHATVTTLRYTVVDARGLSASGSVTITVAADAPMPAPVAKDVFVRPSDLDANSNAVDLDVSGSVTNRTGRRDELAVSVDPLSSGQATLTGPQTIRVTVAAARQIVPYRVTDAQGQTATAFIVVPPQQELVGPQLIAGAGPIRLDAGRSVDVAISDYVTVGGGRPPTIASTPPLRTTQGAAVRSSSTTLTLSAPSGAGGEAAVYVPIDDGAGAVVVVSLPMLIEPRPVLPLRLESVDLRIEAGTSESVDLAALTTNFDEQQASSYRYAVGSGGSGVQTARDGSVIAVSVRPDVPLGTTVAVPIQVVDGDGREGMGMLSVSVTGSRKPLATVVDQQVEQGRAGVEVAADLLSGAVDPIGLGLTVLNLTVVEGAGGIAAGPVLTGSSVRLTPAAGYVGTILLAAEVADGTKDPERVVSVNLRVTIQDRPATPGKPTLTDGTGTAGSVRLAWAPSDANGAVIDAYTVTGDGVRQDCPGSENSCIITGLTVGRPYVFVVTAHNAVGESEPSEPSATITPDAAPSVPGPPSAQYVGRGQLSVSWSVPTGDITPATGTSIRVLQNGAVVEVRENASSPLAFDGLDAGSAYQFQVRANNRAGSSDWSAASDPVVPSGVPSAPTNLIATFVDDAVRRGVEVSWEPPADTGGEPVRGYRLLLNNVETTSGGSDLRTYFVDVGSSNAPVSVSVIAGNGRGEGPPAVAPTVVPFTTPGAVSGLVVTAKDSAMTATWGPVTSAGGPVDQYDYRVDGGAWTSAGSGTSVTIGGLTNGQTYSVEVRACNIAKDLPEGVRCGPSGAVVPGRPFGPLSAPSVNPQATDKWGSVVGATWSFPGGNGRDVTKQTVQVTGAATASFNPAEPTGTWSGDIGFGKSVTVTAEYCVAAVPQDECQRQSIDLSSPSSVSLATVALAPIAGTCGTAAQYAGEWLTDANCAPGTWIVAPKAIAVVCIDGGGLPYPEFPTGNPRPPPYRQITDWYRGTDQNWYRAAAVASPGGAKIPTCN